MTDPRRSKALESGDSPALHAHEAEFAILSAMLQDSDVAQRGVEELHAGMFESEKHKGIFTQMRTIVESGMPLTPVTLADAMPSSKLEIANLIDHIVVDHAQYHFKLIKEAAARRRLILAAHAIADDAANPDVDSISAIARATERLTGLPQQVEGYKFLTDAQIQNYERPEPLIGDVLFARSLAVLYGAPGSGKSFVALDWSLSIATGVEWLGREVKQGRVVYVAPEGSAGLGARVAAWKTEHRWDASLDVWFLPQTTSLLKLGDVARLIATMRALPGVPLLVVFDTLARCIPGGDENSAMDMGSAIAAADRIREQLGCAVLLVHHTNAGGERERGSTALRGAADTMILLKKESGSLVLECIKQKDAQPFTPTLLELLPSANSCVVITPNSLVELRPDQMTSNEALVLQSLHRGFLEEGATATQWMEASGLKGSSFYNARTSLVRKGLVDRPSGNVRGAKYVISEAGRTAVAPSSKLQTRSKSLQMEQTKSLHSKQGSLIKRDPLEELELEGVNG